jgi:hypothetical protein
MCQTRDEKTRRTGVRRVFMRGRQDIGFDNLHALIFNATH